MPLEVQQTLSGQIDFSAFSRELMVPIEARDLIDVRVRMYSLPNAAILTSAFAGGEDYRLYISGRDVTQYLKAEVQRFASALPRERLVEEYLAGVHAYLRWTRHIHPDIDQAAELTSAENFAARPVDEWFSRLGDRSVGRGGNLHPLSFLYRFISLEPISLATVWGSHVHEHPQDPPTLSQLNPLVIHFSQGPAPSIEAPPAAPFLAMGRLVYSLTAQYRNPIEPRLNEIASRLKTLAISVDSVRTTYLHPIVADLEQIRADVAHGHQGFQEALTRIQQTVGQIG